MERITTSHDRFAKEIGFDYGNAVSDTQAALLNGFAEAMESPPYTTGREMQLAYIAHDLTPQAKAFWVRFAEFCTEGDN